MIVLNIVLIVISVICLLFSLSFMFFPIIWEPDLRKLYKRVYKDGIKDVVHITYKTMEFWSSTLNTIDNYKILSYKENGDKMRSIILDSQDGVVMSSFYGIQSRKLSKAVLKKYNEK